MHEDLMPSQAIMPCTRQGTKKILTARAGLNIFSAAISGGKLMRMIRATILLLVSAGALIAGPRQRPVNDLHRLLAMHQSEMRAFFAGMGQANAAVPAFFCDVSFTNDRQVENFLRNVSVSAAPGQVYSQVSFTKMVAINGDVRSVSYQLVNDGANVTLVKSSNVNGQMLRAVYEFDSAARRLKTGTFDGKNAIKNSEYSI